MRISHQSGNYSSKFKNIRLKLKKMISWKSADNVVSKKIITQGDSCNFPNELSICKINVDNPQSAEYSIEHVQKNLHSKIFDETSEKIIIIGEASSKIDRELERAIKTMSLKECSIITVQIPSDEKIDKNLTFSLHVKLEELEAYKKIWEWSVEEKYKVALKYKEMGVQLFSSKRHVDAFFMFSKACKILISSEPISWDSNEFKNVCNLRSILYNNMAECQLCKKNFEHAISLCNKVLEKNKNNIKALYRRGIAQGELRDFEKAVSDLKEVLLLDPQNIQAKEHLKVFNSSLKKSIQGYESIVKKMFKT